MKIVKSLENPSFLIKVFTRTIENKMKEQGGGFLSMLLSMSAASLLGNTKKHLCQSLFSNKVAGLRPAILFKKALAQVISCEFCEMFKNNVFAEHLRATTSDIYKKFHVQPILC